MIPGVGLIKVRGTSPTGRPESQRLEPALTSIGNHFPGLHMTAHLVSNMFVNLFDNSLLWLLFVMIQMI